MLRLFLSSHGHLASGMKSSVEILSGANDRLTVFDAYVNEENVKDVLDNYFASVVKPEDQVILLSDLYGGSVNQVMYLYLDRPNVSLVAGVNLALVLELAVRESVTKDELSQLVEQSRTMLRVVEQETDNTQDTQDDFF